MITTPGVVVACPHCGAHLQWPPPSEENPPSPNPDPVETAAANPPIPDTESTTEAKSDAHPVPPQPETPPVLSTPESATAPPSPPDPAPVVTDPAIATPVEMPDSNVVWEAAETSSQFPSVLLKTHDESLATPPPDVDVAAANGAAASPPPDNQSAASTPPSPLESIAANAAPDIADDLSHFATLAARPDPDFSGSISISTPSGFSDFKMSEKKEQESIPSISSASVSTASTSSTAPPSSTPAGNDTPDKPKEDKDAPRMVSMLLFIIVLSYASAMTLAFGYLMYQNQFGAPHQLESLPDIKPPMKKGQVALQLVPESAELPNGHTLALGNVRVTPLKVTKEPLRFEYYSGDTTKSRAPTSPVLKLWVRFENVSQDQTFSPLDRKLLLANIADGKHVGEIRSNQFVIRLADKPKSRPRVQIYDLPPDGEWDFQGFRSTPLLSPGETWDTYLPTTEEGLSQLEGNLVWRVHIRKGYHPESYNGVTTLFEVRFNSDQIQSGST
ncbi:MAG: hypothetical protein O2955_09285 [Planctomycetota bacterium]|nr:hypothetical protein [Planctomycetota bacterium]